MLPLLTADHESAAAIGVLITIVAPIKLHRDKNRFVTLVGNLETMNKIFSSFSASNQFEITQSQRICIIIESFIAA